MGSGAHTSPGYAAHIGATGRAIAMVGPDTRAIELGLNTAFGIVAAVLALGASSTVSRRVDASTFPIVEQGEPAPRALSETATKIVETPRAPQRQAPRRPVRTHLRVRQAPAAPAPASDVLTANPEAAQPSEASNAPPPEPLQLVLTQTDVPPDRLQFGAPSVWSGQRHAAWSTGIKTALRSSASGLADNWNAPQGGDHDVSFFVSSNRKALNWSLSHASRNYGGVTYQKNRVNIGDSAAGLAVAIGDAQVAVAYVQRDVGSNFGSHSQDYGGVILTLRH